MARSFLNFFRPQDPWEGASPVARELRLMLRHIIRQNGAIMTSLKELQDKADATLAQVTADTDLDNAVAKVVSDQRQQIVDLKAQLDAAIANGSDPAALQALSDTMDHILSLDTSNAAIVSSAVTAGTTPQA